MADYSSSSSLYFREEQQFRQRWIWLILIGVLLVTIIPFGYGMIQQLIYSKPWGDRPMSDTGLLILGTLSIALAVGLLYLFYKMKLITEVREGEIYLRFFPFTRKTIPFRDIENFEAVKYRPIADYGGWGIRFGRKGKAYNVSGNRGVMLHLRGGQKFLIGSQRPEELHQAIADAIRHYQR